MPDDLDAWTTGEIVRSLQRIESGLERLETRVDGLSAGFLPRSEWELWAAVKDQQIVELKAARAPWWTWASVLIALASLLVVIVPLIAE